MLSICRCFSSSKIWFCFEAKVLMSSLLVIVDKLQICLNLWDISRRFRKCNIFDFLSFDEFLIFQCFEYLFTLSAEFRKKCGKIQNLVLFCQYWSIRNNKRGSEERFPSPSFIFTPKTIPCCPERYHANTINECLAILAAFSSPIERRRRGGEASTGGLLWFGSA